MLAKPFESNSFANLIKSFNTTLSPMFLGYKSQLLSYHSHYYWHERDGADSDAYIKDLKNFPSKKIRYSVFLI